MQPRERRELANEHWSLRLSPVKPLQLAQEAGRAFDDLDELATRDAQSSSAHEQPALGLYELADVGLARLNPQEHSEPPAGESDDASRIERAGWRRCEASSSCVHTELRARGDIPDWNIAMNAERVQWVGERIWLFRCIFSWSVCRQKNSVRDDLLLEGLDTFGSCFLNGTLVLRGANMFHEHRLHVSHALREGENELIIAFDSAFVRGRLLEMQALGHGKAARGQAPLQKRLPCWNGDASRLFVRKAQYHYGWDWGPSIMTCGPWKPVALERWHSRIADFYPVASVDEELRPSLHLRFRLEDAFTAGDVSARATVRNRRGRLITSQLFYTTSIDNEAVAVSDDVELWHVVGRGEQPLYDVTLDLIANNGQVLDTRSCRVGFRRIVLRQEPVDKGSSFCFEINGEAIFAGGSNWIPIDTTLASASPERYREWLQCAVYGGHNMIRVWGGGIYESDNFYEICDELGLLVWQDCAFACGVYPADADSFEDSVRRELEGNLRRIRTHPSLALLCGNNEDYQIAESEGIAHDDYKHFTAARLYEVVFPKIASEIANVVYHPGSPFGGKSVAETTSGDLHQWNVWHGSQEPYQNYDKLAGRFVSEFGFESLPDPRTARFFDGDKDAYPQSASFNYHNKADGAERRLAMYLAENVRHEWTLDSYTFATQLVQAEAMSSAIRSWMRNYRGPRRYATAGALVWQLNDVWPATSWALVDYFVRPKGAYFAVKRALAPLSVSLKRVKHDQFASAITAVDVKRWDEAEIWIVNRTLEERTVRLVVAVYDRFNGKARSSETLDVCLPPNRSTEVPPVAIAEPDDCVALSLYDMDGHMLQQTCAWPEPFKFLQFPSNEDVALRATMDKDTITFKAFLPVKAVFITINDDSTAELLDNMFDLVPESPVRVKFRGELERGFKSLSIHWLGKN